MGLINNLKNKKGTVKGTHHYLSELSKINKKQNDCYTRIAKLNKVLNSTTDYSKKRIILDKLQKEADLLTSLSNEEIKINQDMVDEVTNNFKI